MKRERETQGNEERKRKEKQRGRKIREEGKGGLEREGDGVRGIWKEVWNL